MPIGFSMVFLHCFFCIIKKIQQWAVGSRLLAPISFMTLFQLIFALNPFLHGMGCDKFMNS